MRFRTRWSVVGWTAFGLVAAGCGSQATYTPLTFPPGQVAAGAQLFTKTCSACHGPTAQGIVSLAPRLWQKGGVVSPNYSTLTTLTTFIYKNMPKGAAGSLTRQAASNVATFIWGLDGKTGSHHASQWLALLTKSGPPQISPPRRLNSSSPTPVLKPSP